MHDARLLRERPEALRAALERRGATSALASLAQLESLDADWRRLTASVEELKARRNTLTQRRPARQERWQGRLGARRREPSCG